MRHLHRLELQSHLQAESHVLEIIYPQVKRHERKDGKKGFMIHSLKDITNTEINEAVTIANIKAKECIEKLGMEVFDVQKDDVVTNENCDPDNDVTDVDNLHEDTNVINNAVTEVCMEDSGDIKKDLETLSGNISEHTRIKLYNLQKALPKTSARCDTNTFSSILKLKNGTFILKTTLLWLFQEGERVSSDRLLRVREKQPFSNDTNSNSLGTPALSCIGEIPHINVTVEVGDTCVFNRDEGWAIGRVLQFSHYEKAKISAHQ